VVQMPVALLEEHMVAVVLEVDIQAMVLKVL
jgi:hypothetical protein